MSRHSSDVFEELAYYAGRAGRESHAGRFGLAKLTLARIQPLVHEAEYRLRHEADCKKEAEQVSMSDVLDKGEA